MRLRHLTLSVGLAGLSFAAGTFASPTLQEDARAQEEPPSMDELMAAYMAAGAVGEHHSYLAAFVGTWDASSTFWNTPGEPPMEATGVMVNELTLDGRFLQQDYSSEIMGQAFEGHGLWGYSNNDECYKSIWIDNMTTDLTFSTGYGSEDHKTFTMMGSQTNPMSGVREQYEDVCKVVDESNHRFTRYMILEDGSRVKNMEIRYTRRGQ